MKHKKVKFLSILLLSLVLTRMHAQEALPTSGGNASGSGGSVSYSLGQVVYTTNTGTTNSVTQGVQQPFEISVVTGLEEAKGINCLVYPNPATENVKLKVESQDFKNMTYQLFDVQGKLLENKKIESKETNIAMKNFVPAIYFLKVINSNKEVKTFKITKN